MPCIYQQAGLLFPSRLPFHLRNSLNLVEEFETQVPMLDSETRLTKILLEKILRTKLQRNHLLKHPLLEKGIMVFKIII